MSTTWCCLYRPCVAFFACVHLALFLALFLSPGNSLVSSWCDHSRPMLASSLWQCLTVPSLLQFCWEPTHLFSLLSTKHAKLGYRAESSTTFSDRCTDADDRLFARVTGNSQHLLRDLLPPRQHQQYSLRRPAHNYLDVPMRSLIRTF